MEERRSTQKLLSRRKLTRALAELLRKEAREYLAPLVPLLRPKNVFGEFVEGKAFDTPKGTDKAVADFTALYDPLEQAKIFGLAKVPKTPIEVGSATVEMTPLEYVHEIATGEGSKKVTITSPFSWVLHYQGYSPTRVRELLPDRSRGAELVAVVHHTLLLQVSLLRQPGVLKIFEGLRFRLALEKSPAFSGLPVAILPAPVGTVGPDDDVILESTERSGMAVFAETAAVDDIVKIPDPLRDQLLELAKKHGESL